MDDKKQHLLPATLFAIYFGLYFLWCLIAAYMPGGVSESEEFAVYLRGLLGIPALAFIASAAVVKIKQKYFSGLRLFYPVLLLTLGFYFLIGTWQLRAAGIHFGQCSDIRCVLQALDGQIPSWQTGEFARLFITQNTVWTMILLFPILTVGVVVMIKPMHRLLTRKKLEERIENTLYSLIPFVLGIAALNFSGFVFEKSAEIIIKSSAVLMLLIFALPGFKSDSDLRISGIVNGIVITLIALFISDPAFSIERHHQSFFLGPVNDLQSGKSLLVDSDCQYGVLVIYFLNAAFSLFPFSFQGFSLLVMTLYVIFYAAVYYILRDILKSLWAAIIVVLIVIQTNYFATIGESAAAAYPSIGPLRFGMPYLLFLLEIISSRFGFSDGRKLIFRSLIVATASLWSFETFFYTLGAYLAVLLYESCLVWPNKTQCFKNMAIGIIIPLSMAVVGHELLTWQIWARAGEMPNWNYYYDFIFLYSSKGFGSMRIAPWTPWLLTVIIPLGSLFAVFAGLWMGGKSSKRTMDAGIVTGLCGLALAQFTYFLGRSHPNNLYHISVPVIVVAAFWIVQALRDQHSWPKGFRGAFVICGLVAASFLTASLMPRTIEKITGNLKNYRGVCAKIHEVLARTPTTPQSAEALEAIGEFAKDKSRIGIFLSPDDTAETMILSRKANIFPVNSPHQTENLLSAKMRALDFKPSLSKNDVIFVSRDTSVFQQLLVKNIQDNFHFRVIKQTPHGILVIRLE